MALGRRKNEQQQMWVATTDVARSPGHPFYRALNELLREGGFDRWVEKRCAEYYAQGGRPGIPPGVYFRMIFIGYFEGIGSQRGIAWRCSDSLSLGEFLGVDASQRTPDHSSLSVFRQRLPIEVFYDVFTFVLKLAEKEGFFRGKIAGIDATLLEANAAMKSIVRRDTNDDWKEYVKKLAAEEGVEIDDDEDLRRYDKNRKNKTVSNNDWTSPTDPDSRIMRMKNGRTHLAYKVEHAIDLETDLAVAAEVYAGDESDGNTIVRTAQRAQEQVRQVAGKKQLQDLVADKGYHKVQALVDLEAQRFRPYIPEREDGYERRWTDKPEEQEKAYRANRRRVLGRRGKRLQRLRSEYTERSFAHTCETGDARRSWLRGLDEVRKRHLALVAGRNLGVIMREVFGFGSPRSMQDLALLLSTLRKAFSALSSVLRTPSAPSAGPNLVWAA